MTKKNTILLLVLAAILLTALCLGVTSCGSGEESAADSHTVPIVGTEKRTYTVVLKTGGGKALENVGVYFYTDSTMAELVWFAKTDAEGKVSFTDLESTGYVAVLDKVPEGYQVEPYYPLSGETTEIILETEMTDGDLANLSYKLGDVMMNFTVTDAQGNTWVLSDLLAEKDAVVLNFWYLQCAPCRAEFPFLQEAYEQYSDKIALIAMNPINDSDEEIRSFAEELGLTFPMAHCDPNWEKAMQLTAYPTTVVIDRFGTIALIHKGSIDDSKVFEDAFEFFTQDDYEQTTVENIKDLEIKPEGSDSSDPISIGSKTSFDVTLAPGQTAYYHIYRVDGMTLTVSNTNIRAEYKKTNYPSGNGLSFTVNCPDTYTPAEVSFTNDGRQTETFTVRLSAKAGTIDNPISLKLGKFTVSSAAGNDKGVVHTYTPKKAGLLTIQCNSVSPKGTEYKIEANTQMANGGTKQESLQTTEVGENGILTISVRKGVPVQIVIGAMPDSSNQTPAAKFKCTLSIGENTGEQEEVTEKLQYAVTVTDQDMVPVPGVRVTFTKVSGEEEKPVDKVTQEAGVAVLEMEKAVYGVTLSKKGYVSSVKTLQLTPDGPYASVKMMPVVTEIVSYTIVVKDMNGEVVPDAVVSVGSEKKTTDADGIVVFELQKGSFEILVRPPEDSGLAAASMTADGETAVVEVSLQESGSDDGPGGEEETVTYTVTVVDYNGTPQKDVDVQFRRGTSLAAAPITDGNGRVTVSLVPDDYTLSLAGTSLHYESDKAVMPKGTTELTIKLAPAVDEDKFEMVWDMYCCYYIYVGGNYAKMEPNEINYFIFEPQEPGVYRFSTSNPEAILSFQNNSFFINDSTGSTDYDPATNSFTRNWKAGMGGDIVIGVTGAKECIIEVTRISDPILDESDILPEAYKPAETPEKFTISKAEGSKLKYVDLSGKTEDYRAVLGSDGYYHLNSATGPLLYINLGPNAPYHSLRYMAGYGPNGLAGTGIGATIYDANKKPVKRYDFTQCVLDYGACADPTYGVYPLNEDLRFVVQTAGEYYGWWNSASPNFWLGSVENLNPELGWMFAVCYVP